PGIPGYDGGNFLLGYDVREDRDLIEELVTSAPVAFDDNGTWKPGRSVAALLVTDLVVDHAQKIHAAAMGRIRALKAPAAGADAPVAAAESALQEVETKELPGWMRRAFGILLRRPDGRTIALGYLAHLVEQAYRDLIRSGYQEKRWSVFESGIDA